MRRAALFVVIGLLFISCGGCSSARGRVVTLGPALAAPNGNPPGRDVITHDADIIAKRLAFLGYHRPRVSPHELNISVQLPRSANDSLISDVVSQRGELAVYRLLDARAAYDALKTVDSCRSLKTPWPGLSFLDDFVQTVGDDLVLDDIDYPEYKQMLEASRQYSLVSSKFLFGPAEQRGDHKYRRLYVSAAGEEIHVAAVKQAVPSSWKGSAPGMQNTQLVSLQLERKDADTLAMLTGLNVGRRLAIVVDGTVYSAPLIQDRVADGGIMIVMYDTPARKARALAAMLASGVLRVPWYVETTEH